MVIIILLCGLRVYHEYNNAQRRFVTSQFFETYFQTQSLKAWQAAAYGEREARLHVEVGLHFVVRVFHDDVIVS